MNKLSFVIPCYGVKEHIVRNKEMWTQLSDMVDLLWVEDTVETELKSLIDEIGGKHFSKPNGNWGSVINYAVEKRIVETEYVAIVDPDDMLSIDDLQKLIDVLSGDDLYITNYLIKNFKTKSINKKSYKYDKYTFVHQVWFKTSILYNIPKLPENHFFMDNIVIAYILSATKTYKNIDVAPYIYFVNFEGQSTAGGLNSLKGKLISSEIIKGHAVDKPFNKKLKWRLSVCKNEMKYHSLILVRAAYDNEKDKSNRSKLVTIYKEKTPAFHPIRTWLLWSRLYVIFKK